jgi:hypothetical protein
VCVCKDAVAALETEQLRAAFLANVDVSAVEAMSKHKEKDQYVKGMRQATWRHVAQLESVTGKQMPQATHAWLLRKLWQDDAEAQYMKTKQDAPARVTPEVVVFDEVSGIVTNVQTAEKQ